MSLRFVTLICLAFACTNAGTTSVDFRHKKPEGGKPVASWNGDAITDAELKQRFAEMSPYARARYQTAEQKKEYLDGLARFEMLAQEAVRRGLANDPDVVETTKKALVVALRNKELDPKAFPVTDEQVSTYYEKHKGDYVKPAMTRLSHIFFRTENKARAEATLKEAMELKTLDYAGFAKLARERSEEPRTQPIEGDMRFLSDDEMTEKFGKELVDAQKDLAQVGQVLPHLVVTDKGFHVIRLQGRQVALNLAPEQVKAQIQSILQKEGQQEHYRALLDGVVAKSNYKVDDAVLGTIEIDAKAPAAETKGPPPGFLPPPEPKRPDK